MLKQITVGTIALGALATGLGDASVLNVAPLEYDVVIDGNSVQVSQIDSVVKATLPWKDQPGVTLKYDMGKPTTWEKLQDKRTKQVLVEQVTDGLKIDILLNEKPDTNVFCYQLEGWENYDFFHQPALTNEEIAEGSYRPEEIVGSYAVYHKTLKNHMEGQTNYETGKVAHIPYPYTWSVNATSSTKRRAEAFTIENGNMCVTVAQSDLDTMEYPIRVDPTFGYTTAGASHINYPVGGCTSRVATMHNPLVATSGDVVTSISIYAFASSSSFFNVAIYVSTGTPTTLLGSTTITVGTSLDWATSSALSFSMTGGTTYVQAFSVPNPPNVGRSISFDAGVAPGRLLRADASCVTGPVMTDPFGGVGTDSGRHYSIYATYTTSGGSAPTTDGSILIFE